MFNRKFVRQRRSGKKAASTMSARLGFDEVARWE
jgi:hypothetical protein